MKTKNIINMKNKTSILVETQHFFYILLAAVIFCSCGNENTNEPKKQNVDIFEFGMRTIEHDSCEYLYIREPSRGDIEIIHKQNCKFCGNMKNMKNKVIKTLERKDAQLQEVLKFQETETKKSKLNELDKNEIEIKAQISILRHLLSE